MKPVADRDPEWQAIIVARGPMASARRLIQVTLNALAENGHSVTMAHCDEVKPKRISAARKPS